MADQKYVVATSPLDIGYTRAHNPGDLVPVENVERNGWQEGTAKLGTKAAEAAMGTVTDELAPAPINATSPK